MAILRFSDRFIGTEYYVWPRWNLNDGKNWQWTESPATSNEYYLEANGGGAPVHGDTGVTLVDPPMVQGNSIDFTQGTVGSLSTSEFDWGNNDSLGFDTLYVRLADDTDPDSKAEGWVQAGGDDIAGGTTRLTAFETLKYAIETGISRDVTNGDRISLLSGAADTYDTDGINITLTDYATDATEAAPLLIQGADTTANDGGIGRVTLTASDRLWDGEFDYGALIDFRCQGNVSDSLMRCDRVWLVDNCYFKNTATTTGVAFEIDATSMIYGCYFEGESTGVCVTLSSAVACYRSKFVNRGTGAIVGYGTMINCLCIVEGNMGGSDQFSTSSGRMTAYICLGTPSSTSNGLELSYREGSTWNYFENIGRGLYFLDDSIYMVTHSNAYYNVTSPIVYQSSITSKPAHIEDMIDAGQSLFIDAAGGDFRMKKGLVDVSNIESNVGFSDPNYAIDETFDTFTDVGLGRKDNPPIINVSRRVM